MANENGDYWTVDGREGLGSENIQAVFTALQVAGEPIVSSYTATSGVRKVVFAVPVEPITMSGVTSQNVAATIQNSGTLKLENISANVCNAKVQNGSITGSVIGSGSSYGFDLAAGGGKIRVSDANDKNFVFFGKDTLQQNADAPNKLNLATKNGDVEVEFVR